MHKARSRIGASRAFSSHRIARRSPARSCIARHAAVDHEFRACHVAGRIGSEDECSVRYALRLPGPAKRHSGLGDFVPVDWLVAACARRYLRPNRRVDDPRMNRVDPDIVASCRAFHRYRFCEQPDTSLRCEISRQTCRPCSYPWTSSIMMPSGPRMKARRRPGLWRSATPTAFTSSLGNGSGEQMPFIHGWVCDPLFCRR